MQNLSFGEFSLAVDFAAGHIDSVFALGKERLCAKMPLFSIGLRKKDGSTLTICTYDAKMCRETDDGALYGDFPVGQISVRVFLSPKNNELEWRISVENTASDLLCEWVDFPYVTLPALRENSQNGNGGEILYPYNEGAIISDLAFRESSPFSHRDPAYPSLGSYSVFPNMICSQMLAYLFDDCGLYIGAHDPKRGVKAIDFFGHGGGTAMQIRLYCGTDFGQDFATDFPIVWASVGKNWESAAECYRAWFETCLPKKAKKIKENASLPEWYEDSPVVVSYPIRGTWDRDEMYPNAFYPYTNALPLIEDVAKKTQSRVLALLMHWEGTAPWAPPYVWPPYGDLENFNEFAKKLRANKNMLGVYCSGFGYTAQSNLISDYNCEKTFSDQKLDRGMCADYSGEVAISNICRGQRSGYDICPASPVGRAILDNAYSPLFESGIDYVQILDQNHGGGQYFCHSAEHGHPQAPGAWMTENMQNMLSDWNRSAPDMLFGCESAAAEPFIGNLLFSDNRFELNYQIGKAVPLYAYIYHEYVRNFMGNQVSCPFDPNIETLRYRIAYSFCAGDCITLVFSPDGELMPHWGRAFHKAPPNKDKVLTLTANLMKFYREKAKPYLFAGRMTACPEIQCETVSFAQRKTDHINVLPAVLATAWVDEENNRAVILVNPEDKDVYCTVDGVTYKVPALDAVII